MILTQRDGNDIIKRNAETELFVTLRKSLKGRTKGSNAQYVANALAKEVADNTYEFINDGKFIIQDSEISDEYVKIMEEELCRIKSTDGETPLEKITTYINELLQEITEKEEKDKKEGKGRPGDVKKEIEKEIEEEKQKADRTRSQGNEKNKKTEERKFEKALEDGIRFISKKSKKKERKREKISKMSQIHQMNKTQAMFGDKILLYKAAKKQLRIKTRVHKKEKIYISIDNSGSMQDVMDKVAKFMAEIKKSKKEIFYTTWNERVNFPFEKLSSTYKFLPVGNDSLYDCSVESIEMIDEKESILVVITDGTTYLDKSEFIRLFNDSEKKNIHLMLISFGPTDNYRIPEGYEDRLIAY